MSQLTLFESNEVLLADDERGRLVYTPKFVDAATAAASFAELRANVQWRAERRMMYDREVDVPRLVGSLPPRFSIGRHAWRPVLDAAAPRHGQSRLNPFNSVGLNLYRKTVETASHRITII